MTDTARPVARRATLAETERTVSWEELCERGRLAQQDMDKGRWTIGDDALTVRKRYGFDKLGDYAREINMPTERVQEYRTTCAYYQKSVRTDFLADNPTLTYSHLRAAMRFKDIEESLSFLEKAAMACWTVETARIEVAQALGQTKPTPPLIASKFCRITGTSGQFGVIFEFPDQATLQTLVKAWRAGDGKALVMTLRIE
jgi:hypothetical protein